METKRYFVTRILVNGETGAIDYQKPSQFDTVDAAKKEFHNVLSTYINYGKLIKVSAMIYDENMSIIDSEVWVKPATEEVE